ncbi:MAG: hypothetical protein JST54_24705 [Deltaproteobacteria bacterium]|nr:hypothetical protein [Deltaproteobacteria bacterium]
MTRNLDVLAQQDAVLLASRQGDPEAQRLFVARHAKAVYNLARVALSDGAVVEQVLQRTMLEALQAPELPAYRTDLWLGRLAVRQLRALGDITGPNLIQRLALLLVDGLRFSLAEAAWVLDEADLASELRRARLLSVERPSIREPQARAAEAIR